MPSASPVEESQLTFYSCEGNTHVSLPMTAKVVSWEISARYKACGSLSSVCFRIGLYCFVLFIRSQMYCFMLPGEGALSYERECGDVWKIFQTLILKRIRKMALFAKFDTF